MLEESYVRGADSPPLINKTIGQIIERAASKWPDRLALIVRHESVRWTWKELLDEVDSFAAGLLATGLQPGDRVGIWSPNCAEWIVTQYATARAGLILVNINPAYRLHELEFALNAVGCRALVTAEAFKSSHYLEMIFKLAPELNSSAPGHLRSERLPELRSVINIGYAQHPGTFKFGQVEALATMEDLAQLNLLKSMIQPFEAINIQFTSGTTGLPKPATLTHHNVVNNAMMSGMGLNLSPDDVMCIPVPLYHCFGMVLGSLACAVHGSTIVLPGPVFKPDETLEAVQDERCTVLHGVPTMFIAELDDEDFSSYDLSSLRTGIMAGAPCPVPLMEDVITKMHMDEIVIGYGMTETSPISFQTRIGDSFERRVTTVGTVMPHTEVKVIDPARNIVPVGTPGELCTRGYCVMLGYWDDVEHTDEAIDEHGWMRTGDLATIDSEGYCRIVGRIKDMVIRGGENLFPREIEEFLYRHPKIDEVEVFGVPDDKYGEELCAWIHLHPGETADEDEIREFCQDQIAHYKIPRHIKFVETYPMTATGKVQKFKMRELMAEELGVENTFDGNTS